MKQVFSKQTVITSLTVLAFLLLPAAIAYFVRVPFPVALAMMIVFLAVPVAWWIYNGVMTKKTNKELLNISAREMQNRFEEAREAITRNAEENKLKLQTLIERCRLLTIGLLVSTFLLELACDILLFGVLGGLDISEAFLICSGVNGVIFGAFATIPCGALYNNTLPKNQPNRTALKEELSPHDYPLLYDVAQRAANSVGYRGTFVLCRKLDLSGISVSEENGTVFVHLPPESVYILTESELYQILLHEFMHAVNTDTAFLTEIELAKWKYTPHSRWNAFYFSHILERIEYESQLYLTYASRLHEAKADEAIKLYGDPQTYLNGTAKTMLCDKILFALPRREIRYDFYESETVPTDFYERLIAIFEKELPAVLEEEKAILFRTLPTKTDSHPTFRMRADALGLTDFDPFEREPQGAYRAEITRFCRSCSSARATAFSKQQWETARKEEYLNVKEHIAAFEAKGDEADDGERNAALWDYLVVDQDKALALADSILQQDEDNAVANYMKGLILCGRNQDGIAYLDKAIMRTVNCFESAGDMMARYVFSTGNEEIVETFRAKQPEYAQLALNVVKRRMQYTPKPKQFLPCDMERTKIEALKRVVTRIGKDRFPQAAIVSTSVGTEGDKIYVLCVLLPQKIDETVITAVEDLSVYLNSLETNEQAILCYRQQKTDAFLKKAFEIGTNLID